MSFLIALVGLAVFWGLCILLSKHRKAINWKTIGWGLGLQIVFALLVLKFPPGRWLFNVLNDIVIKFLSYQQDGASFVFGALASSDALGMIFAFQVLPTIIFFSSLMSVLYYLGIMQKVVLAIAWVMAKTCKTSGAESLSLSANIFVGQTEAPLLIKPFVETMTMSELLTVMAGGMATVAGGVLAAYVAMLSPYFPSIAGHLIAASVMAAPSALVVSKLLYPETGEPVTMGVVKIEYEDPSGNVIDAAANGASTGLSLALNVATMLIAFIALLALANGILVWATGPFIEGGITLQKIMGTIFAPVAFLMGVEWKDCMAIGQLMAEKIILNEFVAYTSFAEMLRNAPDMLSPKSILIATYALCGFANFSSIGIQIGGIGAIAPSRKTDIAKLGMMALLAGVMVGIINGTMAGIIANPNASMGAKVESVAHVEKVTVQQVADADGVPVIVKEETVTVVK